MNSLAYLLLIVLSKCLNLYIYIFNKIGFMIEYSFFCQCTLSIFCIIKNLQMISVAALDFSIYGCVIILVVSC